MRIETLQWMILKVKTAEVNLSFYILGPEMKASAISLTTCIHVGDSCLRNALVIQMLCCGDHETN